MAIVALSSSGRWVRGALRNMRRTTSILIIMILIGGAISLWARGRIDALLQIDDGSELAFAVEDAQGECGTLSVYAIPEAAGTTTRYRLLIDFLGGANRFPRLGGGASVPVLMLPDARAPGVGIGRGLQDNCEFISLSISGAFTGHRFENSFPGVDSVARRDSDYMSMEEGAGGELNLVYRKPVDPTASRALVAVTVDGIRDRLQEGSRRIALINRGARDLNVFVLEEDGYQFVNELDALVRPIGINRAFVDAYLDGSGAESQNSVVVYRRKPTADIELQHELVGISTIFGIGVSLLVEGMIVLVISLAAAGGSAPAHPVGVDLKTGRNEQEKSEKP
jgi:hypothetical protein